MVVLLRQVNANEIFLTKYVGWIKQQLSQSTAGIGVGDGGGSRGDRPSQVSGQGRKYLSAPQVLSLKNTNKEALSTPQPLSSNYHE